MSTAIIVVVHGTFIRALMGPYLAFIAFVKGVRQWIVVYVIMSSIRCCCAMIVRLIGYVRLYTFDGILDTLTL